MNDLDLFGSLLPETRKPLGTNESNSGGSDEWLTPPHIIDALGEFDLDPCAPIRRPWPTAAKHYTIEDDGLRQKWVGRVWCNPPYAHAGKWLQRMAEHDQGTALVFARTETRAWQEHVWPHASAILFIKGRLRFCYLSGKPGDAASAPSALIAYGSDDGWALAGCGIPGAFVDRTLS